MHAILINTLFPLYFVQYFQLWYIHLHTIHMSITESHLAEMQASHCRWHDAQWCKPEVGHGVMQ